MAWSEAARQASIEARQANAHGTLETDKAALKPLAGHHVGAANALAALERIRQEDAAAHDAHQTSTLHAVPKGHSLRSNPLTQIVAGLGLGLLGAILKGGAHRHTNR